MDFNVLYTTIKSFSVNIFSILIFLKIINCRNLTITKKLIIGIIIVCSTVLYVITRRHFSIMIALIILYFIQAIILKFITKKKLSNVLISLIISVSISYFIFIISGSIEFFIQRYFNITNKAINLLVTSLIQLVIFILGVRIKRLKNGFAFLQKENEYIDITMTNISAILIISYCLLTANHENITEYMYLCFIITGIFLIIMIEKSLVLCYKHKILKKTIEDYKNEIEQKDKTIKTLSEEKFNISKINHEFYHRQKALELRVKEMSVEAGEEIGVLDRINDLTKEYSNSLEEIKGKSKLPSTDIIEIDDMFRYMQTECLNNNIDFKLQVIGNIYYLTNNLIAKNKLETLIGDHIKDAIIAINTSSNNYRSILTIIGVRDNNYELCIYDSGVEFEIDTLLKLRIRKNNYS